MTCISREKCTVFFSLYGRHSHYTDYGLSNSIFNWEPLIIPRYSDNQSDSWLKIIQDVCLFSGSDYPIKLVKMKKGAQIPLLITEKSVYNLSNSLRLRSYLSNQNSGGGSFDDQNYEINLTMALASITYKRQKSLPFMEVIPQNYLKKKYSTKYI